MEISEERHGDVVVLTATVDHEGDLALLFDHLRRMETRPGMRLVLRFAGKGARLTEESAGVAMIPVVRLKPSGGKLVVVCSNPQIGLVMACLDTPEMFKSLDEALEFLARDTDGPSTDATG